MRIKVLTFVLISMSICFYNCRKTNIKSSLPDQKHLQKLIDSDSVKINISILEKDSDLDTWTDNGSFWLLTFKPNKVIYEFNSSCSFWFPSEIVNNEIVFYWELNENCNFDRGLKTTFKGIENPVAGKPFGRVRIINDTTLTVKYYYKEWVNKINLQERKSIDTLFPTSFRRKHL